MRPFRALGLAFPLLLLQACASAPEPRRDASFEALSFETLRDEAHARVERYVDAALVASVRRVSPSRVVVLEDAAGAGVSEAQAALVGNRAAREACKRLARHFLIDAEAPELEIELRVTAIRPTSAGAAGVSALFDVFVPGPFRLPAGLGGFAAEGVARVEGRKALVLRWAEGAGAISESARVSSIGDAYQLAGDFGRDFARALVEATGSTASTERGITTAVEQANESRCLEWFGRASVAGRGASILLPLAPEAIDAGAPPRRPGPVRESERVEPEPAG